MHELSIAMSVIHSALQEAHSRCARVAAVHLRLGALSGVAPQALTKAFEWAREGTELAECRMVVEEAPLKIYCNRCQSEQPAESIQLLHCRKCGTPSAKVVSGQELELVALEIEV